MNRIERMINKVLEPTLLVVLCVLVLTVLWQVFSRYVLQSPSTLTDEVARILLIWLTLLGAAWVVGQRGHLAIDLISENLAPNKAKWLQLFIHALIGIFSVLVLCVGGGNLVSITLSLEQTTTVLQVPMGYVYVALPLSGAIICLYSVLHGIETFISDNHKTGAA